MRTPTASRARCASSSPRAARQAFDGADGPAAPGEVVWRDDAGVTCRRWNWRQGRRTALTEATRRAFFVFDALAPACPPAALDAAVDALAAGLEERFPQARLERQRLPRP